MSEYKEQPQLSILAGIRDNLLKPMANEIKHNQQNGNGELRKTLTESLHSMDEKIASFEKNVAGALKENQQQQQEELVKAITELKNIFLEKFSVLETKIIELEKFQRETEEKHTITMQQVKWNE